MASRLGAREPCPFCGSTGGVAPDADGYHCLVCGGPRIPVDSDIARSHSEKPSLLAARGSQRKRATWSVSTAVATLLGLVSVEGIGAVLALFHEPRSDELRCARRGRARLVRARGPRISQMPGGTQRPWGSPSTPPRSRSRRTCSAPAAAFYAGPPVTNASRARGTSGAVSGPGAQVETTF